MKIISIATEDGNFRMEERDPKKRLFGVFGAGNRLKRFTPKEEKLSLGERQWIWDYEPIPSSRTYEWIAEHSFTYQEAIAILRELEEDFPSEKTREEDGGIEDN